MIDTLWRPGQPIRRWDVFRLDGVPVQVVEFLPGKGEKYYQFGMLYTDQRSWDCWMLADGRVATARNLGDIAQPLWPENPEPADDPSDTMGEP